ncbi:MAG: DUF4097 family beta strand repeat protein [Clostridia bacterium]|nr:DUF4097 family beta strand repeat protein [Clostridia bacterium]
MMNKRIRSMIDEIFSEMKMTAENLALRDELMANAQARYEDMMAQGRSEEEAFCEVSASLEDVYGLLDEMKRMDAQPKAEPEPEEAPELRTGTEEETQEQAASQTDLGDALNKAFTALGDFSQAIMPEAKKLYGQMDEATGGVLGKLGRAAKKGMRDAQKAAGEAIDKLSKENGELVFDFGANKEAKPAEKAEAAQNAPSFDFDAAARKEEAETHAQDDGELLLDMDALKPQREESAAKAAQALRLREEAEDLRSQAMLKEVVGDVQSADALRERAEELDVQADLLEQAQAMEDAYSQAQDSVTDENGDVDQDAFAKAVDDLTRDAQDVIRQAEKMAQDAAKAAQDAAEGAAEYIVRDANEPVSGMQVFPAAGLRKMDIQLDADDVEIAAAQGDCVETFWEARSVDGEPLVTFADHTLTIRRKNPDVFKTFFSVFKKEGGRITVRVPHGFAADYAISTTSGDVHIRDVDVDGVKVSTTSGDVRVEPDAKVRADDIAVTTVSGRATVSACADTIEVTTVSGGQFISCDAHKVDVNVVSGKVHVEGACDEWEVSSVSGEVELLCTVAPTKKVQISSVHGDVRLALPGEIRGFVAEATGALGCEIINEFGANRYGTCGLPIRMETMHGKLLITRL